MEVATFLRGREGNFVLRGAIGLLLFAMLASAALEIYHVYHCIGKVREKVNESVLAVAAVNVAEFYGGAREADGYARHSGDTENGGVFVSTINSEDVLETLADSLNATSVDDTTGVIEIGSSYAVQGLQTRFVNAQGNILHFESTLTVTVPINAGGVLHTQISKPLKVKSSYDPKF